MKCTMLIVEDHALTAQYLNKNVDWSSIGIDVIGVAANGKEALALMDKAAPDILLTDIRMPIMDGLQLIRYLNEKKIKIKPVILTAYDEFSYAREAIRCGAVDYVLKPIEDAVLKETLGHVQQEITKEKSKEKQYSFLLEKMKNRFPILRNDFFLKLLKGSFDREKSLEDTAAFLQLTFPTSSFCVIITELDRSSAINTTDRKKQEQIISDLIDAIEESFSKEYTLFPVSAESGPVFIVCCNKKGSEAELHSIENLCSRAQTMFREKTSGTFSAGISQVHFGLTQIASCYSEAGMAMEHKFISGPSHVFLYSPQEACRNSVTSASSFIYPFEQEQRLLTYLSIGKKQQVARELENFFTSYENKAELSHTFIKESIITMIMRAINTVLQQEGTTSPSHSGLSVDVIEDLSSLDSLDDLIKECTIIIDSLCDIVQNNCSAKSHHLIEKAMGYISLHYSEDFSIEDVASFVGYCPNYFSHTFKKHMKKSFSRVLTEYRINHAKRLLKKPHLRISEIAEQVGFHDPHYFSHLFGKITGVSPSEFRKQQF